MKENKMGRWIVVCGGEGSGKSSIMNMLQNSYPEALITREPGGAPFAEIVRTLFKSDEAKGANADTFSGLAWGARASTLQVLVLPNLRNGVNVISDRGDCCTYAYQVIAQKGPHLEKLFWHMREVYLREHVPDLYIFLDVSPKIGLKRVAGRPGKKDHFDEREIAFHNDIRSGYHVFFEKIQEISDDDSNKSPCGKSGFVIVDASQPLEKVQQEVAHIIAGLLN
jgi:dTMP kinase